MSEIFQYNIHVTFDLPKDSALEAQLLSVNVYFSLPSQMLSKLAHLCKSSGGRYLSMGMGLRLPPFINPKCG